MEIFIVLREQNSNRKLLVCYKANAMEFWEWSLVFIFESHLLSYTFLILNTLTIYIKKSMKMMSYILIKTFTWKKNY